MEKTYAKIKFLWLVKFGKLIPDFSVLFELVGSSEFLSEAGFFEEALLPPKVLERREFAGFDLSGDFDLEIDFLAALLSVDDCVESRGLFRLK